MSQDGCATAGGGCWQSKNLNWCSRLKGHLSNLQCTTTLFAKCSNWSWGSLRSSLPPLVPRRKRQHQQDSSRWSQNLCVSTPAPILCSLYTKREGPLQNGVMHMQRWCLWARCITYLSRNKRFFSWRQSTFQTQWNKNQEHMEGFHVWNKSSSYRRFLLSEYSFTFINKMEYSVACFTFRSVETLFPAYFKSIHTSWTFSWYCDFIW